MSHARVVPASLLAALTGLLLAVAPANAALYDNSFLYASNYDDGQVDRLAVDALGALGASTSYPASPQATSIVINPEATALFAGSSAGDTIDRYSIGAGGDLTSHAATTPVKGSDLAMTPDGAFLYAIKADSGPASSGTFQGYAVSGATLTQLSPTYTLPAARIATAIAISPNGDDLYVAAADAWNGTNGFIQRYAIDPQTGALSGPTLEASGFAASVFNLALSPNGLSLYAPSPSTNVVYQFDVTPGTGALAPKAAPSVAAGTGPYSVTVTPNGKFAYANGLFAISGFAIDATTGALTSNGAPVPTQFLGRGGAVSPDSRNLYVTAYRAYHFTIDPGTGLLTPRDSSPCCRFHVGLAFTPDQGPVASFTAVAAPEGSATTFDASASADSDGTVATYLWDFHDGPTVTGGPTISHTFATAGSHTVDLTVSDGMGCSNTRTYTGQWSTATAPPRHARPRPSSSPRGRLSRSTRPSSSPTPHRCCRPSRPGPRRRAGRRRAERQPPLRPLGRAGRPSTSSSRRTRRCATRSCGATARRSGCSARDSGAPRPSRSAASGSGPPRSAPARTTRRWQARVPTARRSGCGCTRAAAAWRSPGSPPAAPSPPARTCCA